MKKTIIALVVLSAVMGVVKVYLYHHAELSYRMNDNAAIAGTAPEGYVGFTNDTYDSAPEDKTSWVLIPTTPLGIEVTAFTPDDSSDARFSIRNLSTNAVCDTDTFLLTHAYVSTDESVMRIYSYSGSQTYRTLISTATCKEVASTTLIY
jgi:hypothetical protein